MRAATDSPGASPFIPTRSPPSTPASARRPRNIDQARRLIAAFDAAPGAGAIGLDGKMYDIPHLKAANRTLAAADAA